MIATDIKKIQNTELYLFASTTMVFEEVPIQPSFFGQVKTIPKYPTKTDLNQMGLWYFPIDELASIYALPEFKAQLKAWTIDDIRMGWLYYYFYYNLTIKEQTVDSICATYNIPTSSPTDKFVQIEFEREVLQFASSVDFWNDEIEGFPVNPKFEQLNNTPCQICTDEMMFIKPEFKIALFKKYCANWIYNKDKSTKAIMVFDREPTFLNDYTWQVIIRSPRAFVNTFEVVLAKKSNRKLSPKHVIFQLLFPTYVFPDLSAGQLLNVWKPEAVFRYMYVERYINYIEPFIVERMRGIDD